MPADEFSFDITPQDAIDYLKKRRKTELSWHWSDVQKQEHMRAFTVAKMTSATLLDDVRKSLDKAMAEGQSFQEWRKDIIPKLQGVWLGKTYGDLWDGMTPAEQAGKTPPTPEERDRVIKASRLETIFRTNMFNAYAAGRYRQLKEDADIYPYWRYVTAKDSAVRPAHRALEGKVFKADDPFWSTHYPPNGFNCRCIVEAVDEYDLEMQDLKVQEGGNTYFDEESGQTVYRDAEGEEYPCDKGWDYNVGEDTIGKKTLASKKFPPELTKAVREDLKAEAERLKAEAEELEKARKQAEEESRRADAAQKAAAEAKKQAEAEAQRKAEEQRKAQAEAERKAEEQRKAQAEAERKAEEQRKAQAEAERKAKEQSKKAETEQKRFVVDVTRPSKPSKHPAKKATTEEQKRFVVDVTRPSKPSKRPGKKAIIEEQKRFVVDVTRPDKPSKRPGKKAADEEQKRFVVDVTRPDKPSKRPGKKATTEEQKRFVVDVTRPDKPSKRPAKKVTADEQKRFVVDVTRPNKPSKWTAKKAAADEQKRFVVDVTRPDKPSKRSGNKATAKEQQTVLMNKVRKLNKKFLNQHRNDRLADVNRLEINDKPKAQNGDFIKIGDTSYRKSRIFTEVTCGAEAIIRSVEEKHIARMQNAPLDEDIIDMFDFRNLDKEQSYHISQAEKLARYKELEYIFFYDNSGKVLFGAIGTKHSLAIGRLGLGNSELAGLNCLHNHPSGYLGFSLADMSLFMTHKPKEAKLVTQDKILSFKPEYSMLADKKHVADIFVDLKRETIRELKKEHPELFEEVNDEEKRISNNCLLAEYSAEKMAAKLTHTFGYYGIMEETSF